MQKYQEQKRIDEDLQNASKKLVDNFGEYSEQKIGNIKAQNQSKTIDNKLNPDLSDKVFEGDSFNLAV